jgi:cysteinyl-tRNA synthetase
MYFFNTLTQKKEKFIPRQGPVLIYSCGPTVYARAHIGNLRAFLFADLLVRYLRYRGYQTKWVMNITDVDDKTILGAEKAKVSLKEYTQKYEKLLFKDLRALNVFPADVYPRATQEITEIQKLVQKLYQKGYAYIRDGSVYFDISKFTDYGRLSHLDLQGLKPGARVDVDQYNKEAPADFVLWKKKKEGEPFWILELANQQLPGRPGWHIECSAMAMKYLGPTIDFHLGGVDLIFPHHENEIAQSEAVTGKPFVRFWLHNEHLLVEGEKMSKSLGNFYTLEDLEKQGYSPAAFRYLCLQTHYRSKMDFSFRALEAASRVLTEIKRLRVRRNERYHPKEKEAVLKALDDDLNTPRALSLLHESNNFALWQEFEPVFGLKIEEAQRKNRRQAEKLLQERERLRAERRFQEADALRAKIQRLGYLVEDTEEGPRLLDN